MKPYYLNEALLVMPEVQGFVDRSRQYLEVTLEDGATFDFVVARAPLADRDTLRSEVDKGMSDQRRMLRGFSLLGEREREYGGVVGIEVRLRFINPNEGPTHHYEWHCLYGRMRMGFHGICRVAHADVCDAWMEALLERLQIREE